MAIIRPFKAVRPIPEKAAAVAALPYDVYNREEAAAKVYGDYDTFLRVDRPESTMDSRMNMYDPYVYEQAQKNLRKLFDRRVLIQDEKPHLYIYELIMDGQSQVGLVTCTSIDEYLNNTIKKHELTRAEKEKDRINHVDYLDANTGPIFLTYRSQESINALIASEMQKTPIYDFVAEDGITHRCWMVEEEAVMKTLVQAFSEIESLYIADGHHRAASAAKVALKRRKEHPDYKGDEEFNYFLSVLFPDKQLRVLDYNRVVRDLNGLSKETFLKQLEEKFVVEEKGNNPVKPEKKATFGMFLDNQWYLLSAKEGIYDVEDPVNRLDVAILQNNLLTPILEIGDVRTDNRIDFVGGIRGLKELERRCSTDMTVAFSMYPTGIDELMAIADAQLLMPPKSTWFEPKLRSGLFIHQLH